MPVYLRNELLEVEIGEPGELYSGSRFDHSGNIVQITLNRKHTFCTTEKRDFRSDCGFGLMNEFDIDAPVNFEKCEIEGSFLKIGVGELLREDDLSYNFSNLYKFEPANFNIEKYEESRISFEAQSEELKGYQIKYRKEISISENILTIDYYLKNIGEKQFVTEEYCHNFLSIDHQDFSGEYRLEFNFNLNPNQFDVVVDPNDDLLVERNSISWNRRPTGDVFIAGLSSKIPMKPSWKLINTKSKAGVSENVSFESSKVNLWGNGHVISPELFFNIELNPGEDTCWRRQYTFFEL
jgi:hypothetical protein